MCSCSLLPTDQTSVLKLLKAWIQKQQVTRDFYSYPVLHHILYCAIAIKTVSISLRLFSLPYFFRLLAAQASRQGEKNSRKRKKWFSDPYRRRAKPEAEWRRLKSLNEEQTYRALSNTHFASQFDPNLAVFCCVSSFLVNLKAPKNVFAKSAATWISSICGCSFFWPLANRAFDTESASNMSSMLIMYNTDSTPTSHFHAAVSSQPSNVYARRNFNFSKRLRPWVSYLWSFEKKLSFEKLMLRT